MNRILIGLLLMLIGAGFVSAQVPPPRPNEGAGYMPKNGKIKGKIIDAETKELMEYANVAVYTKSDSKLVTGGITDAKGEFEISGLNHGEFYLQANFIGFGTSKVENLKIGQGSLTIDVGTIALTVDRTRVAEVEVIAEQNRVEYKIDKKVINVTNDINASGGSAVTVLENTPSVEVDIDGNVSLRGSSSFTVLIDGRPSVLAGSDALKQIPSSAIQNIEIITNPSVKYDPDGMAGIINVVMKKNVLSGLNGVVNVNVGTGDNYGFDDFIESTNRIKNQSEPYKYLAFIYAKNEQASEACKNLDIAITNGLKSDSVYYWPEFTPIYNCLNSQRKLLTLQKV